MPADLDRAKYIAFVSYRRDGTAVSTPVWCVPFQDGYAFTSEPSAWKMRRVANNPNVTVQVCGMRGKAKRDAVVHSARAAVLPPEHIIEIQRKLRAKYWIAYRLLLDRSDRKAARRGEDPSVGTAAIKFVLTQ